MWTSRKIWLYHPELLIWLKWKKKRPTQYVCGKCWRECLSFHESKAPAQGLFMSTYRHTHTLTEQICYTFLLSCHQLWFFWVIIKIGHIFHHVGSSDASMYWTSHIEAVFVWVSRLSGRSNSLCLLLQSCCFAFNYSPWSGHIVRPRGACRYHSYHLFASLRLIWSLMLVNNSDKYVCVFTCIYNKTRLINHKAMWSSVKTTNILFWDVEDVAFPMRLNGKDLKQQAWR